MKFNLRLPVSAFLCALVVFGSCSKDEEEEPPVKETVHHGSISGLFNPGMSINKVTAVSVTDTSVRFSVSAAEAGGFKIDKVPVGKYKVNFVANPGYRAPEEMAATVYKDSDDHLGTFIIEKSSSLSFNVNGNLLSADNQKIAGIKDGIYVFVSSGKFQKLSVIHELDFHLPFFTGPGLYNCSNLPAANAYAYYAEGTKKWKSLSGSILVAKYDPVRQLAEGRFSFQAGPADNSTTGTKVVTEGRFKDVHIKNQ